MSGKQRPERADHVILRPGIAHLPADIREVARLANQAGLAGYQLVDARIDLVPGTLEALRAGLPDEIHKVTDPGEPPCPQTRFEIVYAKVPRKKAAKG